MAADAALGAATTSGWRVEVRTKGLRPAVIGMLASLVIGVASTAPAYSLSATLGLIVGEVGGSAPAALLLGFLPTLCIAVAYAELNSRDPDCGTTFTWAARALGPWAGWLGGWAIVVADVVVMADLASIAGQYGYRLIGADGLAGSTFWVTVAGGAWIVVLTGVCLLGLELSARLQVALLSAELLALAVFTAIALAKVAAGTAPVSGHPPASPGAGSTSISWSWFDPFAVDAGAMARGALLAVFVYWGWDTAVAVNEETRDSRRTPGRAAVWSTVVLIATYLAVAVAAQAFAGTGRISGNGDVFGVLGNEVLGSTAGRLLILAVVTSAAACTQTTIMPTARTMLSMAVHGAVPPVFGRVSVRWGTPTVSTAVMGAASLLFYVGLTAVSNDVLADSVAAVSLFIALYYALTGYACVWTFRGTLRSSWRAMMLRAVLPLAGAVSLTAALVGSVVQDTDPANSETSLAGVGMPAVIGAALLAAGVVLMALCAWRCPDFFRPVPPAGPDYLPARAPGAEQGAPGAEAGASGVEA